MAPVYGFPNYDFIRDDSDESTESGEERDNVAITNVTLWYLIVLIAMFLIWLLVYFCLRLLTLRQKTRSSQQRRTYMGSRQRPSVSQTEPTIYVSPANLPPPPKYEAMAPPSYEEVVGIHYPTYQPQIQPITQPISNALAQPSNSDTGNNTATNSGTVPPTVITVTDERTPVTVASS